MAVTENNYVGDGSTVLYSFSFPYLEEADVLVELDDVANTNFSFASDTQLQFNSAPGSGVAIRIYRSTDTDDLPAVFQAGSSIRSQDLNDNFTQTLYVSQEVASLSDSISQDVDEALAAAQAADATAQAAEATAQAAEATAQSAESTANAATSTADSAAADAATAISTANTAIDEAAAANATANSAVTQSSTATTTANSALATANDAVVIAESAQDDATTALNLVSDVVDYTIIDNVGAIPPAPSDGEGVEVLDSTNIEAYSPLAGVPVGFVGSPELRVKINYTTSGSTWNWVSYSPTDPETRYVNSTNGVISTSLGIGTATPTQILEVSNNNNPAIILNNSNTNNSSSRTSRFGLNIGNTLAAGLRAQTTAGGNASDASLGFSAGGDAAFSKMRILGNGNVGIGTTLPDEALHIGTGNLKLDTTSRIYSNPGVRGSVQISSPNSLSGRPVTFGNNFYYDSDETYKLGNEAIGGALLQINSANGDYGSFSFIQKQDPDVGGVQREALTINSSGLVGIGYTNPAYPLSLGTSSGAVKLAIYQGTSDATTYGFGIDTAQLLYQSSGAHTFRVGNVEKARFDSSGRLLVGLASTLSNVYVKTSPISPQLQIWGNSGSASSLSITRTTGAASNLVLQRGQTGGGAGDVVNNDTVGQISFNGFDGTNYRNTAQIISEVDGTPGVGSMPGRLVFATTASGSAVTTEHARINSAGLFGINETNPGARLHVNGTTRFDGNSTFNTSNVAINGGSLTLEANTRYIQDVGFPTGTTSKTFDLIKSNVFGLVTIDAGQTWAFTNPPATGYCFAFSVFFNYTSGSVTFPGGVMWQGGTAPTLASGKGIFTFTTIDGGTSWFGIVNQEFS